MVMTPLSQPSTTICRKCLFLNWFITNWSVAIIGKYMIVTVRLIRNFEYRTIRTIPIREVESQQTVDQFIARLLLEVKSVKGIPPPFKTHPYDTLKISHQAGSFKANDIVINLEDDELLILPGGKTLEECGVIAETELSFFNRAAYQAYKLNPVKKWWGWKGPTYLQVGPLSTLWLWVCSLSYNTPDNWWFRHDK